jgi:hypothetical protein
MPVDAASSGGNKQGLDQFSEWSSRWEKNVEEVSNNLFFFFIAFGSESIVNRVLLVRALKSALRRCRHEQAAAETLCCAPHPHLHLYMSVTVFCTFSDIIH